ncbi:MAG: Gfo/Idh/MocA family oxidoreductase [Armatimonadetes bacterium]|nr:Gfo/Idh/MocA family oxidoreductase [Armatimonadota bacterium]
MDSTTERARPRVVVIGYGWWGRDCHCRLIRLAGGLQLYGVATHDSAKLDAIRSQQGCRAFPSYDAALGDPDVDAVVIATPNHTHADLAVRALAAGKHVVTDKAMCLTLADCDRMIAASERAGRLLTVFQNRRLDDDFRTLRACMADGRLGDVRWMEAGWQGFGAWGGWRGQASAGGGRFYDLGAHLVDQVALLFPERVAGVFCRMPRDFPESDVDSECLIVVDFEGGRTAICDLSSQCAFPKPRFCAHGTRATYVQYGVDPQEAALMAGNIDGAHPDPAHGARLKGAGAEEEAGRVPGRWRDFYENLAGVLTRGDAPLVKLPEARRAIGILDAARRSAETGARISVDLGPA